MQHTFFVHFFAVVLHDYNVASKDFLVTRFMEEMLYTFRFSISHCLTVAIKFSCYSYDEIGLLCFLSLALALSLLCTLM